MFLTGTMEVDCRKGHLLLGGCDLVDLAGTYGTPLYVFDEELIRRNCCSYRQAFQAENFDYEVIYAGKAFLTTAMCRLIEEEGLGLDVVSGGELYTALCAGFHPSRIYFHGNNKAPAELELALSAGVGRIVVDSMMELDLLEEMASQASQASQKSRNIDIYLRVRPGVEAHTHHYIQTGQEDSKFGLGISDGEIMKAVKRALSSEHLNLKGLHCHIGSQIFDLEPFVMAARIMVRLIHSVYQAEGVILKELNMGGGLGIRYTSQDKPADPASFVRLLSDTVCKEAKSCNIPLPKLMIEPGRSIIGEAGITLYTVGTIKNLPGTRCYVSVDGGMTDNLRALLYSARYEAIVANKATAEAKELVTIAGKNCESGDILIKDIELPELERGDILAVLSTGAYHYAMANNYNHNPKPAVVFVRDGESDLIVKRESWKDLLRLEC